MVDNVMMNIGAVFMIVGGAVLVSVVLGLAIYAAALVWVSVSNKLRRRAKRITRCKDCKYRGGVELPCNGGSVDYCKVWDCTLRNLETTFCSYGERKENNHEKV